MARKRRKTVIGRKLNSSGSSPAAEVIAGIIDLLIEILLHLPAKSLVRFKCVSKQWLSLMSHSEFFRNHSRRNPRPPISGLYFYCRTRLTSVSLSGGRNLPPLSSVDGLGPIQNSCNGLLLCHNRRYGPNGNGFYSVCNLTTQKHTPLPKPNWHSPGSYHFACLAFDPSKSLHYKVVMGSYCSSPPYQIDVYCSQSSCWKQVFAQESCYGPGVFWNGAIHWLSDRRGLIRFEVDAEKMIALPNPPTPKILGVDKVRYFGECGGGLILIQSRSCCVVGFRILEMDKDYHGWIVKCRINLRPLIDESPEMKSKICKYDGSKVLCVVKGEKEKDFALVLAIPGRKIVSYNLKSKTWDVLRDLAPGESIDYRLNGYVYPFVETLLPI